MLTTAPRRSASRSANAVVTASGPNRLTSSSRRRFAVSPLSTGVGVEIPALLTTMLTSWAAAAARATESGSVTSSCSGTTRGSSVVIDSGLRAAA